MASALHDDAVDDAMKYRAGIETLLDVAKEIGRLQRRLRIEQLDRERTFVRADCNFGSPRGRNDAEHREQGTCKRGALGGSHTPPTCSSAWALRIPLHDRGMSSVPALYPLPQLGNKHAAACAANVAAAIRGGGPSLETKRVVEFDRGFGRKSIEAIIAIEILHVAIQHEKGFPSRLGYPVQPRVDTDDFRHVVVLNQRDPAQSRRENDVRAK